MILQKHWEKEDFRSFFTCTKSSITKKEKGKRKPFFPLLFPYRALHISMKDIRLLEGRHLKPREAKKILYSSMYLTSNCFKTPFSFKRNDGGSFGSFFLIKFPHKIVISCPIAMTGSELASTSCDLHIPYLPIRTTVSNQTSWKSSLRVWSFISSRFK